jgi:DNA-binding MarR family transcriptional regulator
MKNIPQIESILENIKIGKNTKKAADLLSSIFSVIPIAGGLISKFLESDIDLTSKENEKYILDMLATTVQEISIELQTLSGGKIRGGQDRDQMLFLLDNFQDVDESTLHVMEKIREHLKDPVLSPETNFVAFLLFLNNDSRFLREDMFKNSILLTPYKHFHVHGLKSEPALGYFRENLNFAANRNNDELFSKIFEIYSEEIEINNKSDKYISPKYILETIRHEIVRNNNILTRNEENEFASKETQRISLLSGKFVYNGKPLKINISDTVFNDYNNRIEKLNPTEIEILEVASVLGNRFNISEISYILNMDTITISKEIKKIERDGDILRRETKEDNSGEFIFKKGIYREIFKKRIFSTTSFEGEEIPYQLFTEYCNRGVEYFRIKNLKELSSEEIKRYAHISNYASKKYIKEFITANLEYANYAYTVPELQIDGITSLEKIIIHLKLEKEKLLKYLIENNFLNQFISIFSFYINDFQELIAGNFNQLNPIIEILYENHELFYTTFSPKEINHLTATYLFSKKPKDIVLQSPINIMKFNDKALKECKEEEDILIAKFWEAFLYRISVKKVEGKNSIEESINICLKLLKEMDKIKDPFWNKSYHSRILNNLGQSYQINYKNTNNPEDKKKAIFTLNECITVKEIIKDYTGIAMALSVRSSLQDTLDDKIKDLESGIKSNIEVKNYGGVAFLYGILEELMKTKNKSEDEAKYKKLKEETYLLNRITPPKPKA